MLLTHSVIVTLSLLGFFLVIIVGNVDGKKNLQKKPEGNISLKKITNGLENCVKDHNKSEKEKMMPQFSNCITTIKNKKSLLKHKNKITKSFFKKVFKGITNCLKTKMTKNAKKRNQMKKQGSKNKREKRSKRPSKAEEEMYEAIAKIQRCGEVTIELKNVGEGEAASIPKEKCECGRPEIHLSDASTNARIFKGKEAIRKQFPWQILIHMKFKNVRGEEENTMSGGTLISRKHVLTAAHNFYDEEDMTKEIQTFKGKAAAGISGADEEERSGIETVDFNKDDLLIHPDYIPRNRDDLPRFNGLDIALVTLSKSFLLSEYVKPVCMPYNTKLTKIKAIDEKWDGEPLTITGFGIKDDPEKLPDRLLYANVVKIKSEQCLKSPNTLPSNWLKMKTENFCYKGKNEEVGGQGDSGGPVIWEDKDDDYRAYVMGIMSQIISNPTFTVAVSVPGTIFNWVLDKGGKEVENCLVKN